MIHVLYLKWVCSMQSCNFAIAYVYCTLICLKFHTSLIIVTCNTKLTVVYHEDHYIKIVLCVIKVISFFCNRGQVSTIVCTILQCSPN